MDKGLLAAACASALVLSPALARAQGATTAAAEQLFQDGKKLLDAGKTHEACEKFAASQEAEAGLGTLLHLAACHEKEGKTASAWAEFSDAMAQAQNRGEKDREKYAREHAQALEKQLHRVVLEMMKKPDGLEIKLDGKLFPVGSLGTAIPLDPGDHQIEVRATKKKLWQQTARLGPGAVTERIEIPELVDDPGAPAPSGNPGDDRSATPKVIVVDEGTKPDLTKRWVGIGLGVGGLALGIVAGVEFATAASRDKTSQDDIKQAGNPPPGTTAAALQDAADKAHSQAVTAQTFGFIFGGAGVVALGVGIYLVATSFGSSAPPKVTTGSSFSVVPLVGRGTSGVGLQGTF